MNRILIFFSLPEQPISSVSIHGEAIRTPEQQRTSWKCRYAGLLGGDSQSGWSRDVRRSSLFMIHRCLRWVGLIFSSWTSVCPVWLSLNLSGRFPDVNSMLQILLLVSLMNFGNDLNFHTCWFIELCLCSPLPSSAVTGAPSVRNTGQLFHFCVAPHTPSPTWAISAQFSPLLCSKTHSLMDSPQQLTDMQQEKCHQELKVRNKGWKQPKRGGEGHEKTGETSFILSHTHTQIHTTPLDSVPSLPSEHGLCLFSHFSPLFSPWIRSSHSLAYHGNCYQVTKDLDAA